MKILFISDTHTKHYELDKFYPDIFNQEYDAIVHAGDISGRGTVGEVNNFLSWFETLDQFTYKIFIAGNHDFLFEADPIVAKSLIPDNVTYLENSEAIIDGIKFWGSPITPYFYNWAFNRFRGEDIRKYWEAIPEDTDVLITHGPPYMIGDYVTNKLNDEPNVGCKDLREFVDIIEPKIHVFGHIHGEYGEYHPTNDKGEVHNTTFINASVLNERYMMAHKPIVIEI